MDAYLVAIGVNLASSIIYDCLKALPKALSKDDFEKSLISLLKENNVVDAEIRASEIVQFLVKNKELEVSSDNRVSINLKDICSQGSVTWLEWSTSNPLLREMFQNKAIDINMNNIVAQWNVTWMKLNVDWPAELKQPLNIQGDFGSVSFNPSESVKIHFGINS